MPPPPPSVVRVFFGDIKSTFKPLSPYNGHGVTIMFLYYMMNVRYTMSRSHHNVPLLYDAREIYHVTE